MTGLIILLLGLSSMSTADAAQNLTTSTFHETAASGDGPVCPTWYLPTGNGSRCQCGDEFGGFLRCMEEKSRASVLSCYCVTQDVESGENSVFMANCLFSCHLVDGNEYIDLPSDPGLLEEEFCTKFHRRGPHCSHCAKGYAITAFSGYLTCVACPRSMWLEYLAITILPLTLFYFFVLFFRFHATSALLDSYILFSQIVASPSTSRLVFYRASVFGNQVVDPDKFLSLPAFYFYRILLSSYTIWNLNFFQFLVPPFCLSPNFTALQIIAMDYLTAFYPILLVSINYGLLVLYARNFKPLVIIWKPFRNVAIRFRNNIAINRQSVILSFATFILLSYVKVIYVSADLLHIAHIRYPSGQSENVAWNYNASLPYFGREHVGYGVFALFAFVAAAFLPLFLAAYTCKCFQKLFPWLYSKPQIHAFVQCFQGHYKDGTGGTRDYRFFSSIYLCIRLTGVVFAEYILAGYASPLGSIMVSILGLFILVLGPYKQPIHNKINGSLLIVMALWLTTQSFYHFPVNNVNSFHIVAVILDNFIHAIPSCYFMLLVVRYIYSKIKSRTLKKAYYTIKRMSQKKTMIRTGTGPSESDGASRAYSLPDRMVNPNDYSNQFASTSMT